MICFRCVFSLHPPAGTVPCRKSPRASSKEAVRGAGSPPLAQGVNPVSCVYLAEARLGYRLVFCSSSPCTSPLEVYVHFPSYNPNLLLWAPRLLGLAVEVIRTLFFCRASRCLAQHPAAAGCGTELTSPACSHRVPVPNAYPGLEI